MPLVTLTVQASLPSTERRQLLDAIHHALVAIGVPASDRFQRVLALPEGDLVFDPHYPEPAGSVPPRDASIQAVQGSQWQQLGRRQSSSQRRDAGPRTRL